MNLSQISPPWLLFLYGRAQRGAGHALEAARTFARARSRIDEAGAEIGLVAVGAAAVDQLWTDRGRLIVARSRERRLVGGYQSSGTQTTWLEVFAPGQSEPLVRIPTGHRVATDVSPNRRLAASTERPLDWTVGPTPLTRNIRDLATGALVRSDGIERAHILRFRDSGQRLIWGIEHALVEADLDGANERRLELAGQTPGIMRAYTGRGSHHDNIPIRYRTRAVMLETRGEIVAVGATDGSVRLFRGDQPPLRLDPPDGALPATPEPRFWAPIGMRLGEEALHVAYASGAVVRWGLGRSSVPPGRIVVNARCTIAEQRASAIEENPPLTPRALTRCAMTRAATFSPDGSRVLLVSQRGGIRVRAIDGAPVSALDTLLRRARVSADDSAAHAWLAGVEGDIERWDLDAGRRVERLAQGGVYGSLDGVSTDGRYVLTGLTRETSSAPEREMMVWDTRSHERVPLPGRWVLGQMAAGANVVLAWSFDLDRLFEPQQIPVLVYDLDTRETVVSLTLPESESHPCLSADGQLLVTSTADGVVVRDRARIIATLEAHGAFGGVAMDRDASRMALTNAEGLAIVYETRSGRELTRIDGPSAGLAMSSDGRWVARQTSPGAVVVHDVRTGQEVGRAEASSLGGEPYLQRFRGFAFTGRDEQLVLSGPGRPGHMRLYLWQLARGLRATDTQVLGVGRFQADGGEVVRVYDRNDTAHLLDIDEGRLLATVYSERSGGWVVQTPEGAVDGPEVARGAFVTMLRGLDTPRADAWWAAWDRFAVAGLLERVARGDRVLPPIPGYLARSVTLQAGE